MTADIQTILSVLEDYGIEPLGTDDLGDAVAEADGNSPRTGRIEEGEAVYSTSLDAIFRGEGEAPEAGLSPVSKTSLEDETATWRANLEEILEDGERQGPQPLPRRPRPPPEAECAWYAPIHYFGAKWGIYIRQKCIMEEAEQLARFIDWRKVRLGRSQQIEQLTLAAFYIIYLHEQFHHKVESLAFRLLVASGRDSFRPYDRNVFHKL